MLLGELNMERLLSLTSMELHGQILAFMIADLGSLVLLLIEAINLAGDTRLVSN